MQISESDLPGVGKKHEIELEHNGKILTIITHNTGKREVFLKPHKSADGEKLFTMSDQLARTVGTILEGAYFQPVPSDDASTLLSEDTIIDWYSIDAGTPLVGESLQRLVENEQVDVTVIAIQRDDEILTATAPNTRVQPGDIVIIIGSKANHNQFETLVDPSA